MTDYIKREAAIEAIKDFAKHAIDEGRRSLDAADDSIRLCDEIANIPAADIDRPTASQFKRMAAQKDYAPVVHGKWIPAVVDGTWAVCSKCSDNGRALSRALNCKLFRQRYKYCPHCGAKMDGEDGE